MRGSWVLFHLKTSYCIWKVVRTRDPMRNVIQARSSMSSRLIEIAMFRSIFSTCYEAGTMQVLLFLWWPWCCGLDVRPRATKRGRGRGRDGLATAQLSWREEISNHCLWTHARSLCTWWIMVDDGGSSMLKPSSKILPGPRQKFRAFCLHLQP